VPSVDPGDSITAQWSCLPSRTVDFKTRYCYHPVPGATVCDHNQGLQYQVDTVFTGATSPDFVASTIKGKTPITAPGKPGLYTYSLTCTGQKPLTLTASFRVKNTVVACKVATINTLGTGRGADVVHGSAWEVKATVEGTAYDFCIDNPTTNSDFFVPLTTKAEVNAFLTAVNSAAGLGDGTETLDQVY
jgi:hypothetical protein